MLLAAAALVAAALTWSGSPWSTSALAFDLSWNMLPCTNVAASEVVFLDDAPGRAANDESAYFMVRANDGSNANEQCTVFVNRTFGGANMRLRARAAVNDGAALTVFARSGLSCSGVTRGSLSFAAQNQFSLLEVALPAGQVQSICIRLDDDPNTHGQRISALISEVRVADASNTQVALLETFDTPT
jgi:hypothetical protein